ncbi:hypothetical protein C8J56DRAFT_905480 [Mycena floridula]|nr:hypothetical protein C8J56DRAFT_905480 [Mycena floridula]
MFPGQIAAKACIMVAMLFLHPYMHNLVAQSLKDVDPLSEETFPIDTEDMEKTIGLLTQLPQIDFVEKVAFEACVVCTTDRAAGNPFLTATVKIQVKAEIRYLSVVFGTSGILVLAVLALQYFSYQSLHGPETAYRHRSHISHMCKDRFGHLSHLIDEHEELLSRYLTCVTASNIVQFWIHGLDQHSISLSMPSDSSVSDMVHTLELTFPEINLQHSYLVYPNFSIAPLVNQDVLTHIGIIKDSTISFQLRILGGSEVPKKARKGKGKQQDSENAHLQYSLQGFVKADTSHNRLSSGLFRKVMRHPLLMSLICETNLNVLQTVQERRLVLMHLSRKSARILGLVPQGLDKEVQLRHTVLCLNHPLASNVIVLFSNAEAATPMFVTLQEFTNQTFSAKIDGVVCGGHATLRTYKKGKAKFIGCSNWDSNDKERNIYHRYTAIPSNVWEKHLEAFFNRKPLDDDSLDDEDEFLEGSSHDHEKCLQIWHPAHLPQHNKCKFSHFCDNKLISGFFDLHKCNARITILIPLDRPYLAVIIPEASKPHNHPTPARAKNYIRVFSMIGNTGTLLEMPKQKTAPGMVALKQLPKDQRYIQGLHQFDGDGFVVITMNSYLASLVHHALWIMVDTTFKVVHGKPNEWKLVIWSSQLNKHAPHFDFGNSTRTAFGHIWNGTFAAVDYLTNKKVTFRLFSKTAKLLCAIGDSEAAQAQGFGDCILAQNLNDPSVSGLQSFSSDEILLYLWKTCIVHYICGVLALEPYISADELAYLKKFPYLDTNDEIETFKAFCSDWWSHKTAYPWLLPSINRHLTQMNKDHFDLAPNDSNAIEGSHVQDNQVNGIQRNLQAAILMAEKLDAELARILQQATHNEVLTKDNNTPQDRFTSNAACHSASRSKKHELDTEIQVTQQKLKELRKSKRSLKQPTTKLQTSGAGSIKSELIFIQDDDQLPDSSIISYMDPYTFAESHDGTFDQFITENSGFNDIPADQDSAGCTLYAYDSDDDILMLDPF